MSGNFLKPLQKRSNGNFANFGDGGSPPPVDPPVITQGPKNITVKEGETATFTINAENYDDLQWQENDPIAVKRRAWADIPGANGLSYTTDPTTMEMNGNRFRCQAKNTATTVTSTVGFLYVTDEDLYTITIGTNGKGMIGYNSIDSFGGLNPDEFDGKTITGLYGYEHEGTFSEADLLTSYTVFHNVFMYLGTDKTADKVVF
ncbi:immunoglobulin domain-containing protein [Vibrio harveyi]|uniref:immunoglobulin domain-containing protein n=1 Tax=Vibrio harveyi TaxID=669 RepID=UPI00217E4517|nr:immunoglobulin domain-containing protein [Vibrio harveyi]